MTSQFPAIGHRPRLTSFVWGDRGLFDPSKLHVVGVLQGEGVGAEVVPVALELLAVLREHSGRKFDIREGGIIGFPAKALFGESLSPEVTEFAANIFRAKGALFCGPGGERFVYDLRRKFDLFCKFTPLEPLPELRQAGALRPEIVAATDIIAVRENLGGIYQGEWKTERDADGCVTATHSFKYTDKAVRRILRVALELAASRRKRLHVVLKPGGIPSISKLWRECTDKLAAEYDVEWFEQEIDNAVYQLIANPQQYDVLLSPNMLGDVLADCGSLLLGSRGLSYSGNFNEQGCAVYQTGHGAARDISGKDIVNPIGQILSLGMMLRESFNWVEADAALRQAIRDTLRAGFCTRDVAMPDCKIVGTRDFANELKRNLCLVLTDTKM
jgi:3-isopropylmalate dehydrogenase